MGVKRLLHKTDKLNDTVGAHSERIAAMEVKLPNGEWKTVKEDVAALHVDVRGLRGELSQQHRVRAAGEHRHADVELEGRRGIAGPLGGARALHEALVIGSHQVGDAGLAHEAVVVVAGRAGAGAGASGASGHGVTVLAPGPGIQGVLTICGQPASDNGRRDRRTRSCPP